MNNCAWVFVWRLEICMASTDSIETKLKGCWQADIPKLYLTCGLNKQLAVETHITEYPRISVHFHHSRYAWYTWRRIQCDTIKSTSEQLRSHYCIHHHCLCLRFNPSYDYAFEWGDTLSMYSICLLQLCICSFSSFRYGNLIFVREAHLLWHIWPHNINKTTYQSMKAQSIHWNSLNYGYEVHTPAGSKRYPGREFVRVCVCVLLAQVKMRKHTITHTHPYRSQQRAPLSHMYYQFIYPKISHTTEIKTENGNIDLSESIFICMLFHLRVVCCASLWKYSNDDT